MSAPTIVVAIKGMGLGGAEMLIAESARFWDRSRFDYRVAYALPWKNQLVPTLDDLGIPVTCLGTRRGMTPTSWLRLRREVTGHNAALVHAHLPAMGAVARVVSPVPVVYTEHNVAASYRRPVQLVNRLTYARNIAVTAVSDAVATSIAHYPGPAAEIVPNGVAVSVSDRERAAIRQELGLHPGAPLIVHVGNIRPHKGHSNLVAAAGHLRVSVPEAMVVSIGGEKNTGDLDRVRREAAAAGVEANLRFLGRRTDALSFIAAADVFLNPSDFEGLPVAILEAMALDTPVVATNVGGVPGVIQDGVTGVLVPPQDPVALAAGVARVLGDDAEAKSLADAAHRLIETDYSLEAMVRTMESIYARVLGA